MEENGKLNDVANEGENSQDSEKKSEYSQEGTIREETSTQLDESSQLSQENESKDEQKDPGEEVEEEKYDDSEINAKNLEILHNDINYGIVLAFIDKFGKHFSFKEIKFDQFEQNIINIRSLNKNLCDIFFNLLRNLSFGKYVRREKFDYYMTKFTNRFSHDDALEIEKSGYAKLKIESKITIIKNLLESQFDENQKLKQVIAEQTPDQNSLRTEPNGKDLNGLWYFVYMDSECSIRVFSINHREMNEDLTSWKLVAKNLNDLKLLVEKLSTEPALEKLRSSNRYQEKYKKEPEKMENSNGTKDEAQDNALVQDEETKDIKAESKGTETIKEEIKKETVHDEKIKEEAKDEPLTEKTEEELEPKPEYKMDNRPPVQGDKLETKNEKIEPEKEMSEQNDKITQEKEGDGPETNDETEVEPIALRKSTRSSVRKMQQIEPLKLTPKPKTNVKSTPKSVKKSKKKAPKKKSPKQKNATRAEYIEDELDDEEIEEEDDDEEFAPSPSKKKNPHSAKKKSGQKKKPSLLDYESGSTISDESDQESACVKCQKVKSKQILILCDGCDAPYHIGCLKPPLLEIPEGDWFCEVCTHDQLIRYLEQKISLIEKHNREVDEASHKAQQNQKRSYTDISTYLDNLFSSSAGRKIKQEKPKKSIFEETVLEGPRSCRLKSRVKYTFEDFDKSINQACGEEAEEEISEPRPTRATRRSSRLNENFDTFNSEAESDAASNSSEYKAKIAKPRYKSESEEMSEEEAESDEDFGKKKPRNARACRKRAKNAKKRRTRSKYCDDTESEVEETEEEEEEEARLSDEDEINQWSRRRKRRVYQEWNDAESETISDHENTKVRSTRAKSKRRNYRESSGEEEPKEESECEEKAKSSIKKPWSSDQEDCDGEVPAKKAKPIIKRPWSDEDSAESKPQQDQSKLKVTAGENGNEKKNSLLNGSKGSQNENKSQVVNEASRQSAAENKPINLPEQNFVPNTFIATAAPLVYYYCQPAHIQPAPIIQMNGQIQNQLQPIVLMNIPSQSFIKPS